MNKRRIIGIIAAVLLALVGTLSLIGYVNSAKDQAVADEALVEVYVVDEFVPKGAVADTVRSAVSVEEVPSRLVQDGAITDLADLGDDVTTADLQPGDQLVAARLGAADAVAEGLGDKVQVSAILDAERAVGGTISEGDLVGVHLSFEPFTTDEAGSNTVTGAEESDPAIQAAASQAEGESTTPGGNKTPNVSRMEFREVLVTNVQTTNAPVTTGDEEGDDTVEQVSATQYVVTLALSPEQSERFVFATEFGSVWLSLQPAGLADDGTRPVTLGNVFAPVVR
jgi:pilus assembly protein CpaB